MRQEKIPHKRLSSHLYPLTEGDLIYIPGLRGVECLSRGESVLLGYAGSEVKWSKSSVKHIRSGCLSFRDLVLPKHGRKGRLVRAGPGSGYQRSGLGFDWKAPRCFTGTLPGGGKNFSQAQFDRLEK